jgi:hypothetical protein
MLSSLCLWNVIFGNLKSFLTNEKEKTTTIFTVHENRILFSQQIIIVEIFIKYEYYYTLL